MEDHSHARRITRALRRLAAAGAGIVGAAVLIAPSTASAQPGTDEVSDAGPTEQMPAGNYDYNNDGLDDVVARRNATGALEVWPGNGSGSFGTRYSVSGGWNAMNLIETGGDLNNDGQADFLARETSTGRLYFYPGNGATFDARVSIGAGWQVMGAIVSGHDYNGDGNRDILAVEEATGTLWLYPGAGTGSTYGQRFAIGSSFNEVHDLTAVGDANEDGFADVIAVLDSEECMYFYGGPGSQGFQPRDLFDCGWDVMESAAAVGEFTGDGHLDWVGRESDTGWLYVFYGDGAGSYFRSPVVDSGWGSMTIA